MLKTSPRSLLRWKYRSVNVAKQHEHHVPKSAAIATLHIDRLKLALAQDEIQSIEPAMDVEVVVQEGYSIGWVFSNKKFWPAYCLSGNLDIWDQVPESRKLCVLLKSRKGHFALLCDQISFIDQANLRFQPIPICMQTIRSPLQAIAEYDDDIVAMSTTDHLAGFLKHVTAHVLVVDDSKVQLAGLRKMLEKNGFKVSTALSGEQSLMMAKEERPDVIIMDVMMPGMDGFETTRVLSVDATTADIPVVILTASEDNAVEKRAQIEGASGFIRKPTEEHSLVNRLESIIYRATQLTELNLDD